MCIFLNVTSRRKKKTLGVRFSYQFCELSKAKQFKDPILCFLLKKLLSRIIVEFIVKFEEMKLPCERSNLGFFFEVFIFLKSSILKILYLEILRNGKLI